MNILECLQNEYGVKDHIPINAEIEWSKLGITLDVFGKYRDGTIAMNARHDDVLIVRKFYPHPELRSAR